MDAPSSPDAITAMLATIHERQRGYGFPIEPPATAAAIAALRSIVSRELGAELPAAYADFLSRSDGLDWNGTVFFAAQRRQPTSVRRGDRQAPVTTARRPALRRRR